MSQKSRLHRLLNRPSFLAPEHSGFDVVERVRLDGTVEILSSPIGIDSQQAEAATNLSADSPVRSEEDSGRLRLVAPYRLRDLTPDMHDKRCCCGVRVSRHYDGWDGNRLSCEEALRRHGVA